VFAVYAVKERRKSSRLPKELKPEKVVVDTEGWETKASDAKERQKSKASNGKVQKGKSDD
jgi:hypothetical protein